MVRLLNFAQIMERGRNLNELTTEWSTNQKFKLQMDGSKRPPQPERRRRARWKNINVQDLNPHRSLPSANPTEQSNPTKQSVQHRIAHTWQSLPPVVQCRPPKSAEVRVKRPLLVQRLQRWVQFYCSPSPLAKHPVSQQPLPEAQQDAARCEEEMMTHRFHHCHPDYCRHCCTHRRHHLEQTSPLGVAAAQRNYLLHDDCFCRMHLDCSHLR